MSVDSFGNDVSAVGIPVTGFFGYAPAGTTFPTPSAGAAPGFTLPGAFTKGGLLTEDGGFEWTLEPDGDPITFWQDGYQIPSGLANATLVAKMAQYDNIVRKLSWGKTPDANGFITIDAGGHSLEFVYFTEEIFKNGAIRRRIAQGSVTGAKVDKSERGTVNGTELTFKMRRSVELNNEHIGEWWLAAPAASAPVATTALPTAQGAGQYVDIVGSNFLGATQVKFGAQNAATFVINSDTSIRAWLAPGSSGTANVTVINAAGTSNAVSYTRAA